MAIQPSRAIPWPDTLPYHRQSVEVPGTKRPGQTGIYKNAIFGPVAENFNGPQYLHTLDVSFEEALQKSRDRPCLGHRPQVSTNPVKFADQYVWETYGQVDERRRAIGSALHYAFQSGKVGGGEFQTIGIWSANRPEWQILDLAAQAYAKVSVSLYDTLGPDSVAYIINHAHLTVIFTTSDHITALLTGVDQYPFLKLLVSIDDLSSETTKIYSSWGSTVGVQVTDLRAFEQLGKTQLIDPIRAAPEQLASICYTSGTTNNPKGVLLTHKMLASAVQANLFGMTLDDDAVLLSYLPLAHIYERVTEMCTLCISGSIGYFTGDPLRLLEDAQILKPTFFPSVPRVLNRVYQAAMVTAKAPGIKGALFRKALATKLEQLHTTGVVKHALWDRLVFNKVGALLGGRVRLIISGSAPISPDAMDFIKIAFPTAESIEGYGMTENAATCTRCIPNDPTSSGTVGPPAVGTEIKLVDVPAMGYTSEDKPYPRGELCTRAPGSFTQYYKDEKNTKGTVDEEGWVHTGDVAAIDECGRIKIIDRVKNIMKLAQGEYVALEKVENVYSACPIAAQIFIHGDGLQPYLLAVIIPDPVILAETVAKLLKRKVSPQDVAGLKDALKEQRIKDWYLTELNKEAKKQGLKGFEMIKRLHLSLDPFSVEDDTLTPTLKIKRKNAYEKFKKELDALYALGEPTATADKPSSKL